MDITEAARGGRAGRLARRLAGAGLAWAAALLIAPGAARAGCDLSAFEFPVRLVGLRPVATLTLNGVEVPMLVDSGAFFSMLPESTATHLKLKRRPLPYGMSIEGYTGRVEASMTQVDKVGFNGVELRDIDFIVGGNELGGGIKGILGRNFLSIGDTEYDLAHGIVRLMFPKGDCKNVDFAYWAGTAPVIEAPLDVALREADKKVRVAVLVNGSKVRALMDTGAPYTTLTLDTARRAGVKEADMTPIGRVGGGGEGRVRSWTAVIGSFEFGGEKIGNNRFGVDDTDNLEEGMLLGLDYFLSHRIYVSKLQRKVYATYNGGPVFAKEWNGSVFDERHVAAPASLAADDADGLARRGTAAAARGDLKTALADLDRACELAPKAATHFMARSQVQLALREPAKALADLDEALRLDPALHEARADRARLRVAMEDKPGALLDLKDLDEALPPSAHQRAGMADLYAGFDMPAEALRQWALWEPSHQNDTGLAEVLNNRCWLRARLGTDLPLALDDCKAAVRRDGGSASYRDSLGWIYWRLGDAPRAVKAFDEALALKADQAWSLYGRGLAYRRQGNAQAAERDLDAARKLVPGIDERVRKAGFLPAEPPAQAGSAG
ncbi:aspartyl protease family protein [Roseateles sp.]|uniref:aspartyl protease family protein n=1 Tax=Roseateles sp. TaxID=1971397 RepID=UPI002E010E68|nr:aspartyl protease family protein [Roseateles sp.]